MTGSDQQSWVAAAVDLLRERGSWTGRVHIHKLLAMAKTLGLADPPFSFELYHYGPYSYPLDTEIAEMEMYGLLRKEYPEPGWGPRYDLTASGRVAAVQASERARQLAPLANLIGNKKSQDLELIATWLWVKLCENITEPARIADRVGILKPKYDRPRIEERGREAERWAETLSHAV